MSSSTTMFLPHCVVSSLMSKLFTANVVTRSARQVTGRRRRRPGVLVGGDGALGDPHLVDLVRAVGESGPASMLQHRGKRRVRRVPQRTADLNRPVDDAIQAVRDEVFGHRDLGSKVIAAVDLVRGV